MQSGGEGLASDGLTGLRARVRDPVRTKPNWRKGVSGTQIDAHSRSHTRPSRDKIQSEEED